MKCNSCGFETEVDFTFCPNCGSKAEVVETPAAPVVEEAPVVEATPVAEETPVQPEVPVQPVQPTQPTYTTYQKPEPQFIPAGIERFMAFGKDTLFLVICILYSVNVGFSLIKLNFPIINILITIFLWLAFVQFKKDVLDPTKIKYISGTVFAKKVINYVISGLLVVAGLFCAVAMTALRSSTAYINILNTLRKYLGASYTVILQWMSAGGIVIFIICVIVAAVTFVLAFLGINSIHKFIQSAYKSMETGVMNVVKAKTASIWLIVFAVFYGLSALGGLLSGNVIGLVVNGSICAAYIIFSIMVRKYFADCE